MLEVKNLHVKYGEFSALRGMNLVVNEGEIVTLLGSNGAGKSTTINAISGLVEIEMGEIIFEGKKINEIPAFDRVKQGIVQVPEGRKLFPSMTVEENLLVGSYLKQTREYRAETLSQCYDLFPKLKERKDQLAGSLSGGEQQMCAISRALMSQPRLLMLDEPSLGIAPIIADQIFEALIGLHDRGITILLIEQNVFASLEIANRGYLIETGDNVIDGSSQYLLENEKLRSSYLGL